VKGKKGDDEGPLQRTTAGATCPASNLCEQRPLEEWRPQFWCGEAPVAALGGGQGGALKKRDR